jgi:hypothetical protein
MSRCQWPVSRWTGEYRLRLMTDDASPESVGGTIGRPPPVIRGACFMLLVVGVASVMFSLPVVLGPSSARCHLARTWIDQANDDKKDWNNVDIGERKPKDVPCDEAIPLADGIRTDEKKPEKTATVPSESVLRIQNGLAMVMGAGMAVSGFVVLRTLSRHARNLALGFAGAGVVIQALGIFSLLVFAFVFYAFAFSPASREIWPRAPRPERGAP